MASGGLGVHWDWCGELGGDQTKERHVVVREDRSLLISGKAPVNEMRDVLNVDLDEDGSYHTVAGFALSQIKELPEVGTVFDAQGWRFEIVDMDGRRIDKLLVYRPPVLHRQKTAAG